MADLRDWLKEVDQMGQLKRIEGADWNLEIGCLTELNLRRKDCPALLFDNIPGYPAGYRIVTCSTATPGRVNLTMKLPQGDSDSELLAALRQALPGWEADSNKFQPQVVKSGPILENVRSGDDVDLLAFPAPKWHELDGGRYIGTGDAVITRDPDTGDINLGTYRSMVQDKKTTGFYIGPGQHGRLHREKYHARGKPCPVAISIGHHPLIASVARLKVPDGIEYQFAGAIRGKPIKVIIEEVTGLPIPADSEIVIAGWCPPDKTRSEGPFGEWTGYYASKDRPEPIVEIARVYHRNQPIILGSPPNRGRTYDGNYLGMMVRSAMLHNELTKCGIPDVRGVWVSEIALQLLIVVSLKQRYAGQAKRAALLASQLSVGGALHGRYVIVVDEDIDPTNIEEVLWAVCTRSDPETDIDIIRRCWSVPLDPTIRKPAEAYFNSRAIIDACKPYEWINEFPEVVGSSPGLQSQVKAKWGKLLAL